MDVQRNQCRMLIVDDHAIIRDSLRSLFADVPWITIVGEAATGEEAVAWVQRHPEAVDLLLMDMSMPGKGGLSACMTLRRDGPRPKILFLTQYTDRGKIAQAIRVGANGFGIKVSGKEELLGQIIDVMDGKGSFPLLDAPVERQTSDSELTQTELSILRMIAQDELTCPQIAERLHRSVHTIEQHRKNIMVKLDIHTTAGLVKYAIYAGFCNRSEEPSTPSS